MPTDKIPNGVSPWTFIQFLPLKHGLDRYKSFHSGWLVFNMWKGFNIVSAKAVVTSSDIMPWAQTSCKASTVNTRKFMLICIFRSNLPLGGHCLAPSICYWAILLIPLHVSHSIVFLQFKATFNRDSKLVPIIQLPMTIKCLMPNSYQDCAKSRANAVLFILFFFFTHLISNSRSTSSYF